MLGSHKFITAGYFLVAGVGGYIAFQQSGATPAQPDADIESITPFSPPNLSSVANQEVEPHTPALLAVQQALAAAESIAMEDDDEAMDEAMEATEIQATGTDSATATETVVSSSPWHVDQQKQRSPAFMLNDDVREYEVVNTEPVPHYPDAGEQIQLTLLNGEQIVVNVKSSKVTRNGDYSWSGHLDGYGDDYPVVMTYGKTSTFAMITTPQGSYSMESVDGVGWLYKNPAEHELTSPGQEDFLEIPHQPLHSDQVEEAKMDT